MSDDTATPAPPAPAVSRMQATVGQTAMAGGSVVSIADLIDWAFKCVEAGHIVTPDQATSLAMALGVVMIGHSLEKIPLFRSKTGRSTDGPPNTGASS